MIKKMEEKTKAPYSLQIIDYWCNTAWQAQKELVRVADSIQLFNGLAVSLFSTYGLCQHWIYNEPCILQQVPTVVFGQLFLDLFLIKGFDLLWHHLTVMGIIWFYKKLPPLPPIYLSALVSTELSTMFLVFDSFISSTSIKFVNGTLFISSFFYTRIYLYSKYLLFNLALHEQIISFEYIVGLFLCVYGLFGVNVFWAIKILKKLFTCYEWMQYAHFLSPCISWFVYSPYINWNEFTWVDTCIWLDLLGQVLLSLCSFQLRAFTKIDTDLNRYEKYFALNEMAAKHVRSFLFVLAKYISIQQTYTPNVAVFCGLYGIHIGILSYIIYHVVQLKKLSRGDISHRINHCVFLMDVWYVSLYTDDFFIALFNMSMILLQLGLQWNTDILYICTTLPLAMSLAERFPLLAERLDTGKHMRNI